MEVWEKYLMYLLNWVADHKDRESIGMSPVGYDEWYDNEFEGEEDEKE